MLPAKRAVISGDDVPERGWLRSGVFLSGEQMTVINEAKRRETNHIIDSDGSALGSITTSYLLHVRRFAEDAGLPSRLMIFEVAGDGELLIAKWILPDDNAEILDQ
jgi:hypothetical protein